MILFFHIYFYFYKVKHNIYLFMIISKVFNELFPKLL